MAKYTCRFLTEAGRIDDVEKFDITNDALARMRASQLLAKSPFAAVELWEDDRLVFRDAKSS